MSGSFQFHVQDPGRGFPSPGTVMDVIGEERCAHPATFLWILGEKTGEISTISAPFFCSSGWRNFWNWSCAHPAAPGVGRRSSCSFGAAVVGSLRAGCPSQYHQFGVSGMALGALLAVLDQSWGKEQGWQEAWRVREPRLATPCIRFKLGSYKFL